MGRSPCFSLDARRCAAYNRETKNAEIWDLDQVRRTADLPRVAYCANAQPFAISPGEHFIVSVLLERLLGGARSEVLLGLSSGHWAARVTPPPEWSACLAPSLSQHHFICHSRDGGEDAVFIYDLPPAPPQAGR